MGKVGEMWWEKLRIERKGEREENLNGKFQKNLKIRTLIRKEEFKIRTQERYKTWNENGNEIRK